MLFGHGVRSEAGHEFKPAKFAFPMNRAVAAALKSKEDTVPVTFLPQGLLIDDKPVRPTVESKVSIGQLSLSVEREKQP